VVAVLALAGLVGAVGGAALLWVLPDGPDHPDRWDPKVVELVEFVERRRDREFEHPVEVVFLDGEAYAKRITAPAEGGPPQEEVEEDDDTAAVLRALGLLEGELDTQEASDQLISDGSAAFYDPETDEVLVKGTELTVATRAVLVHELTHALQDQVADLLGTTGESTDHAAALHAFAEGDANEVESAWIDELDAEDFDRYVEEWSTGAEEAESELDASTVPEAWQVSFGLPYAFGTPFVRKVLDEGGNEAMWKMWERVEPTATVSLLDLQVDADLVPEEVASPEGPSVDGDDRTELYTDTLGAFEWAIPLAEHNDAAATSAALAGWRGDTTVVTADDDGGSVCLDALIAFTGPEAARSFESAGSRWVGALPSEAGATVEADGERVRVHTCDPGPEVEVETTGDAQARLDELALLNDIATVAASYDELSFADGVCFARAVTSEMGVEAFLEDPDPTADPDYPAAASRAAASCGLVLDE
jgi:hypothetical protein